MCTVEMHLLRKHSDESYESAMPNETKLNLNRACRPYYCPRLAERKIFSTKERKGGATLSEKHQAPEMVR